MLTIECIAHQNLKLFNKMMKCIKLKSHLEKIKILQEKLPPFQNQDQVNYKFFKINKV
jgi:predicted thioredoxin/glutaredoxin